MAQTSPACCSVGALPVELYREIVENLHDPTDRKTLLSLSLVCRAWNEQSRKVLYKEFLDSWVDPPDMKIIRDRHIRFLSSILNHPERLGAHVRKYAQFWVAVTRHEGSDVLVELTVKALTAMVNLQELHIALDGDFMPPNLFANCSFRLRTLTLFFDLALSKPCIDFLRAQTEIRHLCVAPAEPTPYQTDVSGLPADACPNLASICCIYDSIAQVAEGRRVVAVKTMIDFERMERLQLDPYNLDFGHLKYMSLYARARERTYINSIQIIGNDIILLELQVYEIEPTISRSLVWHLPNLRILRLIGNIHGYTPSVEEALIKAFNHFMTLQYIVMAEPSSNRHFRFAVATGDRGGGVLKLTCECINPLRNKTNPWWADYGDILHSDLYET